MGRHIITETVDGARVRLAGVFTDAQFDRLPCVRRFGGFPLGYHAHHFGDQDDAASARLLSIPESARDAVDVLQGLERAILAHRYAVMVAGSPVGYYSSKAAAFAALRQQVYAWRRDRGGTALNLEGTSACADRAVPGQVWELRRRRHGRTTTFGWAYVARTGLTEALRASGLERAEVA